MKMLITDAWLRRKIENEPEGCVEAASAEIVLAGLGLFTHELVVRDSKSVVAENRVRSNVVNMFEHVRERDVQYAFGRYVQLYRRSRDLTISQLASNSDVDEEELRSIERDPHHQARPRTVYKLASYFGDDHQKLAKLAGIVKVRDERLDNAALKFAAMSDDIGKLSKEERAVLNEMVKMLKD